GSSWPCGTGVRSVAWSRMLSPDGTVPKLRRAAATATAGCRAHSMKVRKKALEPTELLRVALVRTAVAGSHAGSGFTRGLPPGGARRLSDLCFPILQHHQCRALSRGD